MASGDIPKTMRAAVLVKFQSKPGYQVKEIPVPEVGPNDVLIKIGAAGFCHTDYQVWEGVYESPLPQVPSHEPVGTVVAVGKDAIGKWKVGDRVGALLHRHKCGHCLPCEVTNDVRFCENADLAGLKADGGMAEYMIGDADQTLRLPDSVDFVQGAPLMCAGTTVWAGIEATKVAPGEPIGIIGIGGLGSLAVQFAKALGHPVVAVDNRNEGRELATALTLKADLVVSPDDPDVISKIKKWAGKGGLPSLVGCTDNVEVNKWAMKLLRPKGGVFVPLGLPVDGFKIPAFDLVFQQSTVVGSLVSNRAQAQAMLDCVAKHGIRSWITEIPLERAPELPTLYMDAHLKGRLVVNMAL
ncbi:alcohol dehydrogenase GroES-like domain-containing protein [Massariosphaeria phaeospora]|uniref:Alcohol dehydrogenase GroES-like domain-containing protein n=1 Tax=Massariosphaeria phaeospora TaxID=100035 RepID=A0A7C8I546_9PLEO|nr:alcohol dehydrogenase GroES-like domain-containing protein [Massariosphaeria phaeospora]